MADNQETPEVEAGSSSSQPEKEPTDDKEEDEEKNEGKKAEEDKAEAGSSSSQGNIIYPGKFEITWGKAKDKTYWKLPPGNSSEDPAELLQVCWLQVTGSKQVETGKSYEIKFNISLKNDAFGWKGLPLFLMAKIGEKGKCIWKKIKPLDRTTAKEPFDIPTDSEDKFIVNVPAKKDNELEGNEKLFFGLYEIWSNKWKGGLLINYATVEEVPQGK